MSTIITDLQQLGSLIRETRKKQQLTQIQVAAFCEVGVRFIRELEQGKPSCHLGKALHVLKLLGLSVSINH